MLPNAWAISAIPICYGRERMLAAADAQYSDAGGAAACVAFEQWDDAHAALELVRRFEGAAPYVPGEFWRRELPGILAVLRELPQTPDIVVVDGYVWLDASGRPGLGAHLFEALGSQVPVVGVAKSAFMGSPHAQALVRGGSARPLYVTAVGIAADEALRAVARMHGAHRVPSLLKRVDDLCRSALRSGP